MRGLVRSFHHAVSGLIFSFRNERNFRIHMVISVYVILFSLFFHFDAVEYGILFLVFALVFVTELLNTGIEKLVDLCSNGYSHGMKKVKDIAAGAVLVAAFIAVVTGGILFAKPEGFVNGFTFFKASPVWLGVWILSLPVSICIVFKPGKKRK